MTPEEINAINKRLAEWAGTLKTYPRKGICDCSSCSKESRCPDIIGPGGVDCKYEQRPDTYPEYYRSNAAMDLLGVLVERGYYPCLFFDITRKVWRMSITQIEMGMWFAEGNTIPDAICTAIIELIEREPENGRTNLTAGEHNR